MKLPKVQLGWTAASCHRALRACIVALVLSANASAAPVAVDTELLLLVDVSGSTTDAQFNAMMTSYGRVMTSGAMIDAIQSGQTGKIAASVVFFGGNKDQAVGVAWMEISSLSSASAFASSLSSAARPFMGKTAIGSAISVAAPMFGTESGGVDNGFRSAAQIINVAGDGVDNDTPSRVPDRGINVAAARNSALSAGVDMINGVAIGDRNGKLNDYYTQYVIGGTIGTTKASVTSSDSYALFEDALLSQLVSDIKTGSRVSSATTAVPEPSVLILGGMASLMLLARRRRC